VFFYVIQGFGETRLFAARKTRVAFSCVLGVLLGVAIGFLTGRLGLFPMARAVAVGGVAGLLGVLLVLGAHQRLRE
jgi:hypothetical protein